MIFRLSASGILYSGNAATRISEWLDFENFQIEQREQIAHFVAFKKLAEIENRNVFFRLKFWQIY